jgi:Ca-activated chloride channel family protein
MTAPLPLLTEEEVHAVIRGEDDERRSFGCLRCDRGLLPLKALDVDARIVGTFAHTKVTQTFQNTSGVPVEATYIFPLPDRAAATRFTMEVAGRRVEGELQERGQARQTYDNAIRAGKRASIAEEERPGTFSLRVGNLMAGETATITLELTGPLPVVDGEVTYRFPLVVAPRYMPGTPIGGEQVGDGIARDTDAVPDASRISPPVRLAGYPNPVRLGISVSLDSAGLPLSQVRSALHTAWANESEGLLKVSITEGERLDRDFILRFRLGDGAMRTSARATKGHAEDAFLLTLLPAMTATTKRPRDVVFVVDRSGSMEGWKMIAARRSVARMVDSLRATDRFCVLAFDDRVDTCPELGERLVQASDRNRFRAVEWLATVSDRGGTEMAQPLSTAANLLASGDLERDRVLVFVTDGQVGNEGQLIKTLGSRLKGARVFALGIDQAVNAGFLNRLAALGGQGEAELVESEDRVDEILVRCHRRIDTPLLRDVQVGIEDGDLVGGSLAPGRLPDVFEGVPAVILGKLRRRASGSKPTLVVTGVDASGGRFSARVPVETSGNPALLPAWGRLHLRDLEDAFDGGKGNRAELNQRIIKVSLETKVLCRFTAFVAVDHEVVNEGGRVHKVTQSVESAAGWGEQREEAETRTSSAAMPTGAVRLSAKRATTGSFAAAPPPPAAPSPAAMPMGARMAAPADLDDEADLGMDMMSAEGAMPEEEAPEAPLPEPMPVAQARGGAGIGGLFERAKDAFFGGADKAKKAESAPVRRAPMTTPPTNGPGAAGASGLEAFVERLRDVVSALKARGAAASEEAIETLRLMVEEAAHAGVAPAKRKVLDDAIAALQRGDIDGAVKLLQPIVDAAPAGRRGGAFWE